MPEEINNKDHVIYNLKRQPETGHSIINEFTGGRDKFIVSFPSSSEAYNYILTNLVKNRRTTLITILDHLVEFPFEIKGPGRPNIESPVAGDYWLGKRGKEIATRYDEDEGWYYFLWFPWNEAMLWREENYKQKSRRKT